MITLQMIATFILIFTLLFISGFCIILYIITSPYPNVIRHKDEKYYTDGKNGEKKLFPSLNEPSSIHLSVIVPAYNEEERLIPMLDEAIEFLEKRKKSSFKYEIIIVSDGSTDKTIDVAQSYANKFESVRVLGLVKNRGKGGAVRLGMQSARGSVLLFADADGATKFGDIEKLEDSLQQILGYDYKLNPDKVANAEAVVCGSRAHLEKDETAKRSFFRLFLMHGFHFLVWALCVREIKDTQCGFKLLTRSSAKCLFDALHVERWAFDVEMLYIAQKLNIPLTEIAVNWMEIEGSKIVPFWSWLQMGRDLGLIWLRYKIGAWKIYKYKKS